MFVGVLCLVVLCFVFGVWCLAFFFFFFKKRSGLRVVCELLLVVRCSLLVVVAFADWCFVFVVCCVLFVVC